MVLASINYVDPTPLPDGHRHWSKVEGPYQSFSLQSHSRTVEDISGREADFDIDVYGFAAHHWPVPSSSFDNLQTIRSIYYPEVECVLRAKLPGDIEKVVVFDRTLRQMEEGTARKPVMQVHVDQTAKAAEARVRRHLEEGEIEDLLKLRHALINVWRPITPAIEYPLAVVDWRSTSAEDYVEVDLLYPIETRSEDEAGLEMAPEKATLSSMKGYEVKGETYGVAQTTRTNFSISRTCSQSGRCSSNVTIAKGQGCQTVLIMWQAVVLILRLWTQRLQSMRLCGEVLRFDAWYSSDLAGCEKIFFTRRTLAIIIEHALKDDKKINALSFLSNAIIHDI